MIVTCGRLPSKRPVCVATLGVFDGVHRGHISILKRLKKEAAKQKCASLAITFTVPPQKLLGRRLKRGRPTLPKFYPGFLTSPEEKAVLIRRSGIEWIWFLKTTPALLKLPAAKFVEYLRQYFAIKGLVVGEDFRFGYRGGGGIKYLKKVAAEYGFKVFTVRKISAGRRIISSSVIRELICRGDLKPVRQLLGRYFSIEGEVVKGRGVGASLGFPTANLKVVDYIVPAAGVYAAFAVLDKKIYPAAVNIGIKPTLTRGKNPAVEAHIINFNHHILGKKLKIIFLHRLRNEKKFTSARGLEAAIRRDIRTLTAKYSAPSWKRLQLLAT